MFSKRYSKCDPNQLHICSGRIDRTPKTIRTLQKTVIKAVKDKLTKYYQKVSIFDLEARARPSHFYDLTRFSEHFVTSTIRGPSAKTLRLTGMPKNVYKCRCRGLRSSIARY